MSTDQTRPGECPALGEPLQVLPHSCLGAVERDQIEGAGAAGVAAAKVGGDEAVHAGGGGGVGVADLQVGVGAGKGGDQGVLTVQGGGQFRDGGVGGDVGDGDGGGVG